MKCNANERGRWKLIAFDPHQYIQDVVLVGVGGTGGQLARCLARLAYDMARGGLHAPALCFIDPDVVEEKNIGRQLFSYGDLGRNKARVLAARFNAALGLAIVAVEEAFDSGILLVSAVDNDATQREVAQADGALWLDCGIFTASGQVVLGNTRDGERVLRGFEGQPERIAHLPNAALLFPQLLEPEPVSDPESERHDPELSCAELVAQGEQGLFVNHLVASVAAQYLWRLLYRQPVQSFVSFIDGDSLSLRRLLICREELLPFLETALSDGAKVILVLYAVL